ncbi:MAG: hypothetical protein AB9856_14370 [Cellulosilyticaceae bacterium]
MKEILCKIDIECESECVKCCTYCDKTDCVMRCVSAKRNFAGCQQETKQDK